MKLVILAMTMIGLTTLAGCGDHHSPAEEARPSDRPSASASTWEPPKGLEFLRNVPELRGVSLETRESEFQDLAKSRALNVRADRTADLTSYWVSTDSGENVIVMFRHDGTCSGIQRMQPTPRKTAAAG
jgi:hypothetical protein